MLGLVAMDDDDDDSDFHSPCLLRSGMGGRGAPRGGLHRVRRATSEGKVYERLRERRAHCVMRVEEEEGKWRQVGKRRVKLPGLHIHVTVCEHDFAGLIGIH